MRKIYMFGVGLGILWIGVASCTKELNRTTCFNPTGYCGQSNLKSDRIGGPSWFLWDATPQERLSFYRERCLETDKSLPLDAATTCALGSIKDDAHHYCVHYYLPPDKSKSDAEKDERERNYQSCKRKVLAQHEL